MLVVANTKRSIGEAAQKIILILIIVVTTSHQVLAQQNLPRDSTKLYKSIQNFSKRNKFTQAVHKLIFRPIRENIPRKKDKKKIYQKLIQRQYRNFEGKTIGNIFITTLEPFGYNVSETNVSPQNKFTKTGNNLHIKTQNFTIRNLLLIREGQKFDSMLVKESERLVRTRNYVHDVSFDIKAVSKGSDSVNIYIRELDKWSLVPGVSGSASGYTIKLTDKNFAG
jgi:outer membrane protein assembly factor BamA